MYRITITQVKEGSANMTIILDGSDSGEKFIHLVDDRRDHLAEINFIGRISELLNLLVLFFGAQVFKTNGLDTGIYTTSANGQSPSN